MAPSVQFLSNRRERSPPVALENPFGHVSKKRRISYGASDSEEVPIASAPSHPLGVKPLGNAYASNVNLRSASGLFGRIPEELVFQILEYLDGGALTGLGSTCKALYAFSRAEELWKALFVESPPLSFSWRGTWRSTYLSIPTERQTSIPCRGLFSDVLYRPFFCAHTPLTSYVSNIPARNQIARLGDLTAEEFTRDWADKPFILTEPVKEWPAYHSWSTSELLSQYRSTPFRAEAVDWPFERYVDYMNNSSDESPLYLFDCRFAEKMGIHVGREYKDAAYWAPDCFGEDLFAVLEDQRPDSRWLIVGPDRSGSTFHKDPNATSAWNAVLSGAKYWIMFPSSSSLPPPPGVYISEDQSEVTSPLSIAEWLLGFHAEARKTPGCFEGICGEGEVLHVPSGWYHLVLNLAPSIALTQNFIPKAHLPAALAFLKNKKDQISGFNSIVTDPCNIFIERMREAHPDLLEEAFQVLEKNDVSKKNAWDELTKDAAKEDEGIFSFGFEDDDNEEEFP